MVNFLPFLILITVVFVVSTSITFIVELVVFRVEIVIFFIFVTDDGDSWHELRPWTPVLNTLHTMARLTILRLSSHLVNGR